VPRGRRVDRREDASLVRGEEPLELGDQPGAVPALQVVDRLFGQADEHVVDAEPQARERP
jgi:hypothetical protein